MASTWSAQTLGLGHKRCRGGVPSAISAPSRAPLPSNSAYPAIGHENERPCGKSKLACPRQGSTKNRLQVHWKPDQPDRQRLSHHHSLARLHRLQYLPHLHSARKPCRSSVSMCYNPADIKLSMSASCTWLWSDLGCAGRPPAICCMTEPETNEILTLTAAGLQFE